MPRVKRGVQSNKRRKNVLKDAKGFQWTRSTKMRQAREALLHAMSFQFADRKKKKRDFRRLWQIKIGAGAKANGVSYNKFINQLKLANIELDRKILSELAGKHPEIFKQIVETAGKKAQA